MKYINNNITEFLNDLFQNYTKNIVDYFMLIDYQYVALEQVSFENYTPLNVTMKEQFSFFNFYSCNYISDQRFMQGLQFFLRKLLGSLYNLLIIVFFVFFYNIISSGFGLASVLINFREEDANEYDADDEVVAAENGT